MTDTTTKTRTTADVIQTFCQLEYKVEFDYDYSTRLFSATCVPTPGSGRTDDEVHTGYGATVEAAAEDLLATRKLQLGIRSRIRRGVCISVRDGKFVCDNVLDETADTGCACCGSCQARERELEGLAESAEAARNEGPRDCGDWATD